MAAGNGNASLAAARRWCEVTSTDYVGALLTRGRERAAAERLGADAQLRLLLAGARQEDIRQAEAQRAAAEADVSGARQELASAERDLKRFEDLLASNSGAQKPRDDAASVG